MDNLRAAIDSVFRQESGRIIATLIRISGSFDLAEDAMQEAFASALTNWSEHGIPESPAAWITAVAHRKLIDYARRVRTRQEKHDSLLHEKERLLRKEDSSADPTLDSYPSGVYPDDRLRLIFTCCHVSGIMRRAACAIPSPECPD